MSCIPGELVFTGGFSQITLLSGTFNINVGNDNDFTHVDIGFDEIPIHIEMADLLGFINEGSGDDLFIPSPKIGGPCEKYGVESVSWDRFANTPSITKTGSPSKLCPTNINCTSTPTYTYTSWCQPYMQYERHSMYNRHWHGRHRQRTTITPGVPIIRCDIRYDYLYQPYIEKNKIENSVLLDMKIPNAGIKLDYRIRIDIDIDWFIGINLGGLSKIYMLLSIMNYSSQKILNTNDSDSDSSGATEITAKMNQLEECYTTIDSSPKDDISDSDFEDLFVIMHNVYTNIKIDFLQELLGWASGSQQFLEFVMLVLVAYNAKNAITKGPDPALMIGIRQITVNKLAFDIKDFEISVGSDNVVVPDIDFTLNDTDLLNGNGNIYTTLKIEIPLTPVFKPLSFIVPLGTYPINLFELIAIRIELMNILLIEANNLAPNAALEANINKNKNLIYLLRDSVIADWIHKHLTTHVDIFYRFCSGAPASIPPLPPMNLACCNLQSKINVMTETETEQLKNVFRNMEIILPKLSTTANDASKPILKLLTDSNVTGGPNEIIDGIENKLSNVASGELTELIINELGNFNIETGVATCVPLPLP